MNRKALVSLILPMIAGCSGDYSGGETIPGESTFLESGAIAVDASTEKIFVLQTIYEETPTPAPGTGTVEPTPVPDSTGGEPTPAPPQVLARDLYAIDPDSGALTTLGDVTELDDISLLFPKGSVVLMGHREDVWRMQRFDAGTLEMSYDVEIESPFWGVGYGMDGRYISTTRWPSYDEDGVLTSEGSLRLFSVATATGHAASIGGSLPALAWLQSSDRFVVTLSAPGDEAAGVMPSMRVLIWSEADLERSGFAVDAQGLWTGASLDVAIADTSPDFSLLFGRLDVSPDDRFAVLPVETWTRVEGEGSESLEGDDAPVYAQTPGLKVVTLETGAVKHIPDAFGPVGFTPDGSTIVAYTRCEVADAQGEVDQDECLLLIDTETLATETMEVPIDGALQYYVTRDGNFVVIDSPSYTTEDGQVHEDHLVIYDVDTQKVTQVSDAGVDLDEYITRMGHSELWLVDDGALHRLDYVSAQVESVPLSWKPSRLQYLPQRDRLVMNDSEAATVRIFDPTTREVTRVIALPDPTAAP